MAITDKFKKGESLFATTLVSGISTGTGETITLASVSGLPTSTEITLTFDRVDATDVATPSKMERITGTISGSTLTSYTRGTDDSTEQAHSADAVVEYIFNSQDWNDLIDGALVEHGQDGTHTNTVVALLAGAQTITGVKTFSVTPKTDAIAEKTAETGVTIDGVKLKDSEPYCDVINEKTAATGVTIDGLLIKDSGPSGWDGWQLANETWTYASADDPTFTITVPSGAASKYSVGMRIKLTQTTVKYFIITAVADTVLTVYGGTDYNLVDADITLPFYSTTRTPQGFPLDPSKWTIETKSTSQTSQASPTSNTYYNLGSLTIDIPIGIWSVSYQLTAQINESTSVTHVDAYVALSTADNSASDGDLTTMFAVYGSSSAIRLYQSIYKSKVLDLSTKDTYYLIMLASNITVSKIAFRGELSSTIIRAICAYL